MALTDKQRRFVDESLLAPNVYASGDNPVSDRRTDRKVTPASRLPALFSEITQESVRSQPA